MEPKYSDITLEMIEKAVADMFYNRKPSKKKRNVTLMIIAKNEKEAREKLNKILHPLMIEEYKRKYGKQDNT